MPLLLPLLSGLNLLILLVPGSSAVVCAPTSSGKTFISSYVIQQVLDPERSAAAAAAAKAAKASSSNRSMAWAGGSGSKGGQARKGSTQVAAASLAGGAPVGAAAKEGRVVIVLPTKALVNQLAAQVWQGAVGKGVAAFHTPRAGPVWFIGCLAQQPHRFTVPHAGPFHEFDHHHDGAMGLHNTVHLMTYSLKEGVPDRSQQESRRMCCNVMCTGLDRYHVLLLLICLCSMTAAEV